MKSTYTFGLLQYHHSMVLGEVLNIGLIIYLPKTNELRFIYPKSLERLKSIYINFPEKTILSYFEYFKSRINEINGKPDVLYKYSLGTSLRDFIEQEFLPADSSMLQFSNYNKAIIYTDNIDNLVRKLSKLYFPLDIIEIKREDGSGNLENKKSNKKDWIQPDFKNKIVKIDKDFIFLPNKNELSF